MTDKLLPIVPGCLCWEMDEGIQCHAVRAVTRENPYMLSGRRYVPDSDDYAWEIDREVYWPSLGYKIPVSTTSFLVRIDGFKETEQETARELTT